MSQRTNRHRPRRLTPLERTELRIAHETLRMNPALVPLLGGPTVEQAKSTINFYNHLRRQG